TIRARSTRTSAGQAAASSRPTRKPGTETGARLPPRRPGATLDHRRRGDRHAGCWAVDDRPAARLHQALRLQLAQMGRARRAGADGRPPAVALAPSAAALARHDRALAGHAGADRALG